MTDWNSQAKRTLKAELASRGVTYAHLARLLADIEVDETERAIANKLARGTFTFAFYLQCVTALGLDSVTVELRRPGDGG